MLHYDIGDCYVYCRDGIFSCDPETCPSAWTCVDKYENGIAKYGSLEDQVEIGCPVDHAVLVVGYGTKQGVPYWKYKNSWGQEWGENGFGYLLRTRGYMSLGHKITVLKCSPVEP